jgi:TonB family protein
MKTSTFKGILILVLFCFVPYSLNCESQGAEEAASCIIAVAIKGNSSLDMQFWKNFKSRCAKNGIVINKVEKNNEPYDYFLSLDLQKKEKVKSLDLHVVMMLNGVSWFSISQNGKKIGSKEVESLADDFVEILKEQRSFFHQDNNSPDHAIKKSCIPDEKTGIFKVGGTVSSPVVISRPALPVYSERARTAKLQGVVVMCATVRKDGTIEIGNVVNPLAMGLNENARQALSQWKFKPALKDGEPVDTRMSIEINFTLR